MEPPLIRPGGSINPMTARPVTDLPAPDSPTTPSTSPLAISKETPSMARSVLRRLANSTWRLRTERTGSVIGLIALAWCLERPSSKLRIERVAQPIAQQIDRQDHPRQRTSGEGHDPPLARK